MRDIYKEYRQGLISWDEAYFTVNNIAATASSIPDNTEETDYWCQQMESLGIDAAEIIMNLLGYQQQDNGIFIKPNM